MHRTLGVECNLMNLILCFIQQKLEDVSFEMTEEGEYICGVCNYRTSRKSNWYKHRKKHMGRY